MMVSFYGEAKTKESSRKFHAKRQAWLNTSFSNVVHLHSAYKKEKHLKYSKLNYL